MKGDAQPRCDLLEISYLCGRINNNREQDHAQRLVVICSKFPTFVVESTTFKIFLTPKFRCDLLEISYLCGRINNIVRLRNQEHCVVICSKFPTFVVECRF